MAKRVRSHPKARAKFSKSRPSVPTLFGSPQLLEGEDPAAYDELLSRLRAAVQPVDIIDEMFMHDVAFQHRQVSRWRSVNLNLTREFEVEALSAFLNEQYGLGSADFVDSLANTLAENLPEDQAKSAPTIAYNYIRDDSDAVNKVNKVFADNGLDMVQFIKDIRAEKAEQLVRQYVRRKPDAVATVQRLLAASGLSMDALLADGLVKRPEYLEHIERFDRLTAIAESRRNASLREIDRRRAVLAEALRRGVQEVEDAEFKLVETAPAKEKNAA
jgi:hypothetical protein